MDITIKEEFTEYGYVEEYPDGNRGSVDLLAIERNPASSFERERALGMFRTLERDPQEMRLVFVSRRVTRTAWTDEETTSEAAAFVPRMELGFNDCDSVATCHCGARCVGDSVNDAVLAWTAHLAATHRGEW